MSHVSTKKSVSRYLEASYAASTAAPDGAAMCCPTCGRRGMPVLFGLPDSSAEEAAAQGELILAGCVQPEDYPQWECEQGHEWSGDAREWDRALSVVLSGRPRCRSCGGPTRYLVYPGAEELFLDELANSEAELATSPADPFAHFARICRTCRAVS